MSFWLLPGLVSLLVMGALGVGLALRRPAEPLWPYVPLCVLCGVLWSAGELLASQAGSLAAKHASLALLYTGSLPLPALWWVVVLRYARLHGDGAPRLGPAWERVPLALAAALWGVMLTNPWHGAFLTPVVGGRNLYHGAYYAALAIGYAELVAATAVCLRLARRHRAADVRRGSLLLAAVPALPLAASAFYVSTPWYAPTHFTGCVLAASSGLVAYAAFRTRRLWLLPAPLAEILRHDPSGIVLVGRRGRVFYWNPAAEALLRPLGPALSPDVELFAVLAGRLRGPSGEPIPGSGELALELFREEGAGQVFRDEKSDRWLRIAAVGIPQRGSPAAVALRITDVTAERRAEHERQALEKRVHRAEKLRSLAALAGGIAHDFNNRLASVLGNASLARERIAADSELQGLLEEIESAAVEARELTRELLAAAGRAPIETQRLDVSEVAAAALRGVDPVLQDGTNVRAMLPDDLPPAFGDAEQLREAVSQLVRNACEAVDADPAWITVRTGAVPEPHAGEELSRPLPPGSYLEVEVSDTGPGMDEETRRRAFEPFYSTRGVGRGLGLAVVAGVAHAHRGAVSLRSEPDAGTTVRLLIPAASGLPVAPPRPSKPVRGLLRGGETVLVVDDEPGVRRVARRVLEHLGFRVLAAAGGHEGIALFRQHRGEIRAVLLDLTMPDLGGEAVLEELHRIDPAVPVVLSSGYDEADVAARASRKKFSGFLGKPYRLADVSALLRRILEEGEGPGA